MRIALTALTETGPQDVVINGAASMTVASVARSLAGVLGDGRPSNVTTHPRHPHHPQQLSHASAGSGHAAHGGRPMNFGGTAPQGAPSMWAGGRLLDPRAPAAEHLRDGMVVTLNPRAALGTTLAEPKGLTEIRVIGGAFAGGVHRIGIGDTVLGPGMDADVTLGDPAAAKLRIAVDTDKVLVAIQEGDATLDGEPLGREFAEWPEGGVLLTGSTALAVARPSSPDAHLEPMDGGGLAYNRPPRILPPDRPKTLEVPVEPKKGTKERLRLLSSLLFAMTGVVMVVFTGQWYFLLMAGAYPVIQIGEWLGDRRHGRKSYKKEMKEYRKKKASFGKDLERLRQQDEDDRRELWADPAITLLTATGPRRRLWERRITDPDTLALRFGLADQAAKIKLKCPDEKDKPELPVAQSVPVPLPLPELGVIGIAGARDRSRGLARWLVGQAAAMHSPGDLSIVVLSADTEAGKEWNWVRWLPHSTPREAEECMSLIGADPETVARRVTELAIRITERRRAADPSTGSSSFAAAVGSLSASPDRLDVPYNILVVLDGARLLRRVPGMPQVLSGGPGTGVYAICIDDDERLLPEECSVVASWDWDLPGHVRIRGSGFDLEEPVLADQVSPAWCTRMARSLAPVRDVSREDTDALVPAASRLLDVLQMPDPRGEDIARAWSAGGRTTRIPIGEGADGIFSVDLRLDGPHGLIAGTTGAGKSELLQTIISSLTVANRPDEMTFVLIDYKGGSAFKDCAKLPHTVGMVTDLDGHLTERALESLGAELKRREHMLLDAGAKDIEDYCDLRDSGDPRAATAMPRLVLVIDEFAAMVTELPDFVVGLVDIGRRGRSLGVHLILATQRPAGVVTGDIRANTNLRIALRVTDADESSDVIDDPSAAKISKQTPGRCYVRSGAASPVMVQSSRIGGRRPGSGPSAEEVTVHPLPWTSLGRPLPAASSSDDESTMETDLGVLVEAVGKAASLAGIPRQPSPWLEPLPDVVTLAGVPGFSLDSAESRPPLGPIVYGVTDVPARQARRPLALDLENGGNLYVAGSTRSGRSTVLRTLAGSVASCFSPSDVHIYAIDAGANAMLPLVALPHCGAVVGRDQSERIERLMNRLQAEVSRRQQALAAAGFASIAEQRASVDTSERIPWMLLFLDSWEGFNAVYERYAYGTFVERLLQLVREGAAAGLRTIFTGDRSGLSGQVTTVFDQRLVLRMGNPNDYSFAGINERQVPEHMPPGRTLEPIDPSGKLLRCSQISLLSADEAGTAQVRALQDIARQAVERFGRPSHKQRPMHVDELPIRVTYDQALSYDPDFVAPSPLWALAGAGGDELAPIGFDLLNDSPAVVISGPPRSGRSEALKTMLSSLLDPSLGEGTVPVLLIVPRRSPLRSLEGHEGVLGLLNADSAPDEIETALQGHYRYIIAIDDAELIAPTLMDATLQKELRVAQDGESGLVLAGSADHMGRMFGNFVEEAKRARTGLLLGTRTPDDAEILGVRLPPNSKVGGPAGRALYVANGQPAPLQTALVP